MKNIQFLLMLFSFFATSALMNSCGDPAPKGGKEYTAAYICPMYCKGSGSDKPGTCPACKMDYEKNKDSKAAKPDADVGKAEGHDAHQGHDHDANHEGHDHSGHDHDNHEGHNH